MTLNQRIIRPNQNSYAFVLSVSLLLCILSNTANAKTQVNVRTPLNASIQQSRKGPPLLPPPRTFHRIAITEYTLKNGLNVQLLEDHRVPFVTLCLGIKAGSTSDPSKLPGCAEIVADMLTEGTTSKDSRQIAEEIDLIGGAIMANASYDFTFVSGSALSQYTENLFSTVSDILLNPSFPDKELKLKKANLLQELVLKRSDPNFLLAERFNQVLFGEHPYAKVAPLPDTVKEINRKNLEDFHSQYYCPNISTLIVVGDFNSSCVKELIAKSFGTWQARQLSAPKFTALPQHAGIKIILVNRPNSVQSSLKLGNRCIKRDDPDYFPLLVANQILGGSAFSRLFLNLREQKGYTYGAYSSITSLKESGDFASGTEVRTEVTTAALKEFFKELQRIRKSKVSDKEIADAKSYLIGSFQLGLETQSSIAQRLLEIKIYDLPANYLETYASKVLAVTVDDVQRVACEHIDLDNLVIVVVGDGPRVQEDLKRFGSVTTYDTAGQIETNNTFVPGI